MNRVVRRVATPVLLALVATGLAAAPAGAAPTWVAPAVTLAEGTSPRPPGDSHVVVDAAGNATVAWVEQVGPTDDDHVLVSTHPLGGPWSPPLDISGSGDITDELDLATNANGVTAAVWTRSDGTHDVLQAATKLPGGGWSPPVPVGDPTVNSEAPQVVVDASGNAVATWIAGKSCSPPPGRQPARGRPPTRSRTRPWASGSTTTTWPAPPAGSRQWPGSMPSPSTTGSSRPRFVLPTESSAIL